MTVSNGVDAATWRRRLPDVPCMLLLLLLLLLLMLIHVQEFSVPVRLTHVQYIPVSASRSARQLPRASDQLPVPTAVDSRIDI